MDSRLQFSRSPYCRGSFGAEAARFGARVINVFIQARPLLPASSPRPPSQALPSSKMAAPSLPPGFSSARFQDGGLVLPTGCAFAEPHAPPPSRSHARGLLTSLPLVQQPFCLSVAAAARASPSHPPPLAAKLQFPPGPGSRRTRRPRSPASPCLGAGGPHPPARGGARSPCPGRRLRSPADPRRGPGRLSPRGPAACDWPGRSASRPGARARSSSRSACSPRAACPARRPCPAARGGSPARP